MLEKNLFVTKIEMLVCKKEHRIFFGRNALRHAIYFSVHKRVARDNKMIDDMQLWARFEKSVCWGFEPAQTAMPVAGLNVLGKGVHAKMYSLANGDLILSSQNNGGSGLFEFAILYQKSKTGALRRFLDDQFIKARTFSKWFSENKVFGIKG